MATTPDDVRRIAPEFSAEDDSTINFFIAEADKYINARAWGSKANYARALFAAHLMKSRGVSGGGNAPGGPIQSEKVGDISTTYAVAPPTGNSFNNTPYGMQFEQLKKTLLIGPLVVGFSR